MVKFIQAETKVCKFNEALKFMENRMNYYENELGEPSDWECSVNIPGGDKLWIKQIAEDYFDTMLESENTKPGLRVTSPMDLKELMDYLGESENHKNVVPFTYICGPLYQGV